MQNNSKTDFSRKFHGNKKVIEERRLAIFQFWKHLESESYLIPRDFYCASLHATGGLFFESSFPDFARV